MLSQTSEHALRAVLYLAQRPRGAAVPAEVIAAALGAPANYLAKTLNALAKRGIVASTRGAAGGFRLAEAPETLTVARVVEAFDEPRTGRMCLLGGRPCHAGHPCAAHGRWSALQAGVWAPLRETTIAALLAGDEAGIDDVTFAGTMTGIPAPAQAGAS